jgi:hypothetical protein
MKHRRQQHRRAEAIQKMRVHFAQQSTQPQVEEPAVHQVPPPATRINCHPHLS